MTRRELMRTVLPLVALAATPTGASLARDYERPGPLGRDSSWMLVKDWTFGRSRHDATVHNKGELDQAFYYRYIYDHGNLDRLPVYWSIHRDYPEGDARS